MTKYHVQCDDWMGRRRGHGKDFPPWVGAAEFNEMHVYNSRGSKTFTITAASQLLHNSCGTTYLKYRKITVKECGTEYGMEKTAVDVVAV